MSIEAPLHVSNVQILDPVSRCARAAHAAAACVAARRPLSACALAAALCASRSATWRTAPRRVRPWAAGCSCGRPRFGTALGRVGRPRRVSTRCCRLARGRCAGGPCAFPAGRGAARNAQKAPAGVQRWSVREDSAAPTKAARTARALRSRGADAAAARRRCASRAASWRPALSWTRRRCCASASGRALPRTGPRTPATLCAPSRRTCRRRAPLRRSDATGEARLRTVSRRLFAAGRGV